jgi:lysophospholipase L1-like esterase
VDGVLVATGTNNLLAGDPDFTVTVQTIITRLRQCYPTAFILINSLAPVHVPQLQKTIRRVNSNLRTIAETSGALYLDLCSRFEKAEEPLFDFDGVHFNNSGYARWADLLLETLGTLLAKDRD